MSISLVLWRTIASRQPRRGSRDLRKNCQLRRLRAFTRFPPSRAFTATRSKGYSQPAQARARWTHADFGAEAKIAAGWARVQ